MITGNPDFDLKTFISNIIIPPVGETVELFVEVEENELPGFLDEFDSRGLVSDSGIEKNEDGFFSIHVPVKVTPEKIGYLYKKGEVTRVISPRCITEKLLRIDKLVNSF